MITTKKIKVFLMMICCLFILSLISSYSYAQIKLTPEQSKKLQNDPFQKQLMKQSEQNQRPSNSPAPKPEKEKAKIQKEMIPVAKTEPSMKRPVSTPVASPKSTQPSKTTPKITPKMQKDLLGG